MTTEGSWEQFVADLRGGAPRQSFRAWQAAQAATPAPAVAAPAAAPAKPRRPHRRTRPLPAPVPEETKAWWASWTERAFAKRHCACGKPILGDQRSCGACQGAGPSKAGAFKFFGLYLLGALVLAGPAAALNLIHRLHIQPQVALVIAWACVLVLGVLGRDIIGGIINHRQTLKQLALRCIAGACIFVLLVAVSPMAPSVSPFSPVALGGSGKPAGPTLAKSIDELAKAAEAMQPRDPSNASVPTAANTDRSGYTTPSAAAAADQRKAAATEKAQAKAATAPELNTDIRGVADCPTGVGAKGIAATMDACVAAQGKRCPAGMRRIDICRRQLTVGAQAPAAAPAPQICVFWDGTVQRACNEKS